MKRALFPALAATLLFAGAAPPARADLANCRDLYVGRVWIERGFGLQGFVALASPDASSGSYWIYFSGWSADERRAALDMLTAAKVNGGRINLATDAAGGCGIALDSYNATQLFFANQF